MKRLQDKNLLLNMITYFCLQVINLLVGLVLPRLYLQVYGSEVNGIISTINNFITYFSYLEAGLGATLIYALFKPLVEEDNIAINGILSFSKKQYQKISGIYFVLVVALSVAFPLFSSATALNNIEFASLVFVIGLYGALDFYTMARYRVLLTSDRKEYVISLAMIVAQIVRFGLTWLFLQFDMSVALVKTVPIVTLLLRSVILRVYVKKKYPLASFSVDYDNNVVDTSTRWDALILQISISTSAVFPIIIVSQLLGYKEANVYAIYNMVISNLVAIVSALGSGVSPMMGKIIASNGDIKDAYNLYEFITALVITVVFSVCAIMILPFISFYVEVVDDINYIYFSYALFFSVWGALYVFRMSAMALVNAAALFRENRINSILNLTLQIILGVVLTIFFGINGALVAMIVAALQRNICMGFVINKCYVKKTFANTVKRQIILIAIIVGSFFVGTKFIAIEDVSLLSWIGGVILSFIVVSIIALVLYLIFDYKAMKGAFKLLIGKIKK